MLCPRSFRVGFEPLSEASLHALQLPARSSWWSSLRQRNFGSSWLSPLFFPGRWYGYMTTCIALDPVRRLSFVLGPISFWMVFDPLSILFAPCSCRCAYWWSSLRPRVFESSGLSPGFFPFRGETPVSCLFLSLRPRRSRSPIPSLALSWWSPCPLMRWAVLTLSCYVLRMPSAFSLHRSRLSIPFTMLPLSRIVFADGIRPLRAVALAEGASPHALGSVGDHGVRGGSTYIALHRT